VDCSGPGACSGGSCCYAASCQRTPANLACR
jgi:hypothetical protein